MIRGHSALACSAGISLLIAAACTSRGNRTIGDLVQYFGESGVAGIYQPKMAALIGAREGGGYSGDGFLVEVYLFEDVAKAESLEKSGISGKPRYRNGRFALLVHRGGDRVWPVFKRF